MAREETSACDRGDVCAAAGQPAAATVPAPTVSNSLRRERCQWVIFISAGSAISTNDSRSQMGCANRAQAWSRRLCRRFSGPPGRATLPEPRRVDTICQPWAGGGLRVLYSSASFAWVSATRPGLRRACEPQKTPMAEKFFSRSRLAAISGMRPPAKPMTSSRPSEAMHVWKGRRYRRPRGHK